MKLKQRYIYTVSGLVFDTQMKAFFPRKYLPGEGREVVRWMNERNAQYPVKYRLRRYVNGRFHANNPKRTPSPRTRYRRKR